MTKAASRMARRNVRGFTLPELVIVMVLAGIISVFVLPKLSALMGFGGDAWRDQLMAVMRYAQKVAISHRRMVCVTVGSGTASLRIATSRGATACDAALPGPDGSSEFGKSDSAVVTVSPALGGPLYFQADGRVTTDAQGSTTTQHTFTIQGAPALVLHGETGHVQ